MSKTDIPTVARPALNKRLPSGFRAVLLPLRYPGITLSVLVLLVAIGWAILPGAFAGHDPLVGVAADRFQPPSAAHWFGTDAIGRDLYARVVHGASASLSAVLIAVAVAFFCGTAIGTLAGFFGGAIDEVVMRLLDVVLSVPGLLVSLMLITVLGAGQTNIAIAVGVAAIAIFARVMRAQVLTVRQAAYVEAALASGVRRSVVIWRHVLPNCIGPVAVLGLVEFGAAILSISALSFLGFGIKPPAAEWGTLIADGRAYIATAWWLIALPGLVITLVVLAANQLGRRLEHYWSER